MRQRIVAWAILVVGLAALFGPLTVAGVLLVTRYQQIHHWTPAEARVIFVVEGMSTPHTKGKGTKAMRVYRPTVSYADAAGTERVCTPDSATTTVRRVGERVPVVYNPAVPDQCLVDPEAGNVAPYVLAPLGLCVGLPIALFGVHLVRAAGREAAEIARIRREVRDRPREAQAWGTGRSGEGDDEYR